MVAINRLWHGTLKNVTVPEELNLKLILTSLNLNNQMFLVATALDSTALGLVT